MNFYPKTLVNNNTFFFVVALSMGSCRVPTWRCGLQCGVSLGTVRPRDGKAAGGCGSSQEVGEMRGEVVA